MMLLAHPIRLGERAAARTRSGGDPPEAHPFLDIKQGVGSGRVTSRRGLGLAPERDSAIETPSYSAALRTRLDIISRNFAAQPGRSSCLLRSSASAPAATSLVMTLPEPM